MDSMGMLIDLRRRVESLERRLVDVERASVMLTPRGRPRTPPPLRQRLDEDEVRILHYLQSSKTQPTEDADIKAITRWLLTPQKKNGPRGNGSRSQSPQKR